MTWPSLFREHVCESNVGNVTGYAPGSLCARDERIMELERWAATVTQPIPCEQVMVSCGYQDCVARESETLGDDEGQALRGPTDMGEWIVTLAGGGRGGERGFGLAGDWNVAWPSRPAAITAQKGKWQSQYGM